VRLRLKRVLRAPLNRVTSNTFVCIPDAKTGQTGHLMGFPLVIIGRSVKIG